MKWFLVLSKIWWFSEMNLLEWELSSVTGHLLSWIPRTNCDEFVLIISVDFGARGLIFCARNSMLHCYSPQWVGNSINFPLMHHTFASWSWPSCFHSGCLLFCLIIGIVNGDLDIINICWQWQMTCLSYQQPHLAVHRSEACRPRECWRWEKHSFGCVDAGGTGQWPRESKTQPLPSPAWDSVGSHLQHQSWNCWIWQRRRGQCEPMILDISLWWFQSEWMSLGVFRFEYASYIQSQ